MKPLTGRTALVTGASRGIGRACAVALARAGASLALNFRTNRELAGELERELAAEDVRCVSIGADVSQSGDVARLVEETQTRLGPIDILVNNAGIARRQTIEEATEQDWDEIMGANLKSCFLVTQAVLPGMRARRWGRIVNLSSVAAQTGGVIAPHYAASKAGMHGLTHFYANYLATEGITVNAVAPALIETDMVRALPNASAAKIPVGRFGRVEEVADVVVMLASNGYITGQTINVNGGWYMS